MTADAPPPRGLTAATFACRGLAIGILAAIGAVLAFAHPRYQFGTLVGDDAGYYFAITRNALLGHGWSFDRLHATNGFNPLVPLLLVPLDRWFGAGGDLVACFRTGTLLTWGFVIGAVFALRRLTRRVCDDAGAREAHTRLAVEVVTLFLAAFVALKGYYGMDAFLVLALGLAYLDGVAARGVRAPGAWAAVRDGGLLGAACLARVDSLPLAAAAFAIAAFESGGRWPAVRAAAARLAVFLAIVVPYLAWNANGFGSLLPVSARIKSGFPELDLAKSFDAVLRTSLNPADIAGAVLGLAAGVAGLLWAARRWRAERRGTNRAVTPATLALAVASLYLFGRLGWMFAFSRYDVQGSYFIMAHALLALGVARLCVAPSRPKGFAVGGLACVALVALALGAAKVAATWASVRAIAAGDGDEWVIARRIHDATREHDVLYGGAYGLIGYAADRRWINGDGVANNLAYQDAIRAGGLARYLEQNRVTHVAFAVTPPADPGREPFQHHVGSALYGVVDSIRIDPGAVVLRERMRRSGGMELWLVRWPATEP